MAAAQTNNYWLTLPPASVGAPPKPPAPEIPDLPFAAARHVQVWATEKIPDDLKLIGPVAPIWLGADAVALPVRQKHGVALMAWEGDHFDQARMVADSSTVKGAAILDMAISRDGKRVVIAANSREQLQIWIRETRGAAPPSVVGTIDGACRRAAVAWLDAQTVAVGAQLAPDAAPADQSDRENAPSNPLRRRLYVVHPGEQQPPAALAIECLDRIDPASLIWSPDGSFALARGEEGEPWTLIDRAKSKCTPINVPGLTVGQIVDWESNSRGFLFTAAPQVSPDPAHAGVMEYTVASHQARLLASPATAAAYAGEGAVAVLGSRRLNAPAIAAAPHAIYPAEIAFIDPSRSRMEILPTGFDSTAAALLHGYLTGSASGRLAASFQVPHPKGAFTALVWVSPAAHNGGVMGTGRGGTMVARWSPDSTRLAVLAGLPDHPTLAIVAVPHQ